MTTIAYKNGIIAYDSRYVCEDVIVDDKADKHIERDGVHFFLSGACSDFEFLVDSYLLQKAVRKNIDARALVVEMGGLFVTAVGDTGIWRCEEDLNTPLAIGSGWKFALAHMDAGKGAKEAILNTMLRDPFTGGKVRSYDLTKNVFHDK